MNESVFVVPTDILHRPEVVSWRRQIEPDPARAVMILWLALAGLARSTGRAGFIPAGHQEHLGLHPKDVLAATQGAVPMLAPVEGGFVCRLFAVDNAHLDHQRIGNQRKGGLTAGANRAMREAQKLANQEVMFLTPDAFVGPDGQPIPPAEVTAARALIINLDRALGHDARMAHLIPPGLISTAARIAGAAGDDGVRAVLVWINHMRTQGSTHPALPRTTEAALESWAVITEAAHSA